MSYYDECVKHFNVRVGEHIGISPLTKKQIKPNKASYNNFSVLTRENKKFLLELKESPLIMRGKLSLNRNITSPPVHLFDSA